MSWRVWTAKGHPCQSSACLWCGLGDFQPQGAHLQRPNAPALSLQEQMKRQLFVTAAISPLCPLGDPEQTKWIPERWGWGASGYVGCWWWCVHPSPLRLMETVPALISPFTQDSPPTISSCQPNHATVTWAQTKQSAQPGAARLRPSKSPPEDDDASPPPERTLSLAAQHWSFVLIKTDMSRIVKGLLVSHYHHKNVCTACLVVTPDGMFTSTPYFN